MRWGVLLSAVDVCCSHWLIAALAYGKKITRREIQTDLQEKGGIKRNASQLPKKRCQQRHKEKGQNRGDTLISRNGLIYKRESVIAQVISQAIIINICL